MRKRMVAITFATLLLMTLLAGCGSSEPPKGPAFEGEFDTPFSLGDALIINISGEPKKYVNCKVTLEVEGEEMVAVFAQRLYRLREIVNFTISSKTQEELSAADAKTLLVEEIAQKINEDFSTEAVKRAYFDEYFIYN